MLNVFEERVILNNRLPIEWQSQSALDEMAAFLQSNWENRSIFYEDGKIESRQQFISFLGQKALKTNNYIGTIVFKRQQLNIFPKFFQRDIEDFDTTNLELKHLMKNLAQWIEYCTKIDYPYISITSELEDSTDLRELFIKLYLKYVKSALDRGLYYRYEDQIEDSTIIKGKVDFKNYLTKKFPNGQLDKFSCCFSTFEFDNTLNQIIKYTCIMLLKEASKGNQKYIRHILMKLTNVSNVRCTPHDCDNIKLSKLHRHYGVILSMSKMFLLNKTPTNNYDDAESFCFLFPTELLFEGFIGGFIQSLLDGRAKVRLQASDVSVFSDVIYAGQSLGKTLQMKHDLLVEHKDKGLFILDTKYKKISRFDGNPDVRSIIEQEVKSVDIYQMLSYARVREVKDAYLLYPLFRYEDIEPENPICISTTVAGSQPINIHLVRLPFVFEENFEITKEKLAIVILRILEK